MAASGNHTTEGAGGGEGARASVDASRRLRGLLQVAQDVNSSLELTVVLDRILWRAREALGAEGGSIMLLDSERRHLRVMAARGPREREILGRTQGLEEGVAGWVVRHGEPLLLRGRIGEEDFARICERSDLRDAVCAPLRVEGAILGAISLSNRLHGEPAWAEAFNQEDLDLLVALANQAAVAIRNAESYERMREHRTTVERLLNEVNHAQVAERQRIALQLHDGPAQTMYAALRNLEAARLLSGTEKSGEEKSGAGRAFEELEVTIRRSIDETRAVMLDLRPPVLDEWGLEPALRHYAQLFEKRTGIRMEVRRVGRAGRLGEPVESCFYRITQEALTNVWKHAGARSASVALELRSDWCSLQVRDDGRGFAPEEAAAQAGEHFGLMSLRDRAQLVGGRLDIACRPGKGTTVTVTVPIEPAGPAGRGSIGSRGAGSQPVPQKGRQS